VLERPVRVKVHRGSSPEERAQFDHEVHSLAAADGPTRERVFDAGVDGDLAYAVLEARDPEATTRNMAVVPAPTGEDRDLTQPIATDHTAELPVPPLLLPAPEPAGPAAVGPRWSARAMRNVAIIAVCLLGLGALVAAARSGPSAVDPPVEAPAATTPDSLQEADVPAGGAAVTTPTTEPPTTTVTTEAPRATLLPPGFPFGPEGGPRKEKRAKG
jgi:hypothetical protein